MRKITNAARALNLRAARKNRAARRLPYLLMLSDPARLADPAAVLARLPRGAGVVLRDYESTGPVSFRLSCARALAQSCRLRGLRFIVAGDARFAIAADAAGLHLPEWRVKQGAQRDLALARQRGLIVTAACHSLAALRRAEALGADAVLLAPVLPTRSHPGAGVLGPLRFAALVRATRLPVYALGGIDEAGAARISQSGAAGIAGIGFAMGGP
jgi:thiamine-phosphate pyrophosphorylase